MPARQAFEPTRTAMPARQLELSLRTCLTIAGTTPMAAIAGRQIHSCSPLKKFPSRKPQSDLDGNPSFAYLPVTGTLPKKGRTGKQGKMG
jgi:hypothetical protein